MRKFAIGIAIAVAAILLVPLSPVLGTQPQSAAETSCFVSCIDVIVLGIVNLLCLSFSGLRCILYLFIGTPATIISSIMSWPMTCIKLCCGAPA